MTIRQTKIDELFKSIFDFCRQYDMQGTPLVTGTARVRICCQNLNAIREFILSQLDINNYPKLDSSISWGSGKFPRVPWIGFHILGKTVSNSLSVVVCFSRDGRGIVVGLMSAVALKTSLSTTSRTKNISFLNVNSTSKTCYNNKFINPKEFYADDFKFNDLIKHITSSLTLLYQNLPKNY